MVIIIMGVAGSGKTTIGLLLAKELGWTFFDADDYHSAANRAKMSTGIALTDDDRANWLLMLKELITQNIHKGNDAVLACSALKHSYRKTLEVNDQVKFIHLRGTYEQIKKRLDRRSSHFMTAGMLDSQFDTLEEPQNAFTVDITNTPQDILVIIRKGLNI
jgi:gluconokinase